MASYYAFDGMAEPGRRLQPMFMRRTKSRRSKTTVGLSLLCVLLLVWGWRSSGIGIVWDPAIFYKSDSLAYSIADTIRLKVSRPLLHSSNTNSGA